MFTRSTDHILYNPTNATDGASTDELQSGFSTDFVDKSKKFLIASYPPAFPRFGVREAPRFGPWITRFFILKK